MTDALEKVQSGASVVLGATIGILLDSGFTEANLRAMADLAIDIAMAARADEPTPEQVTEFGNAVMGMMGPDLEWRTREMMRKMEDGSKE